MTGTKEGADTVTTRVSRQEELLFGPYAPFVRRLGQLATEAEQARVELERLLTGSREADTVTETTVRAQAEGSDGTSPHTRWLERLYERAWEVTAACYEIHADCAGECLAKHREFRMGVDSQPSVEVSREQA